MNFFASARYSFILLLLFVFSQFVVKASDLSPKNLLGEGYFGKVYTTDEDTKCIKVFKSNWIIALGFWKNIWWQRITGEECLSHREDVCFALAEAHWNPKAYEEKCHRSLVQAGLTKVVFYPTASTSAQIKTRLYGVTLKKCLSAMMDKDLYLENDPILYEKFKDMTCRVDKLGYFIFDPHADNIMVEEEGRNGLRLDLFDAMIVFSEKAHPGQFACNLFARMPKHPKQEDFAKEIRLYAPLKWGFFLGLSLKDKTRGFEKIPDFLTRGPYEEDNRYYLAIITHVVCLEHELAAAAAICRDNFISIYAVLDAFIAPARFHLFIRDDAGAINQSKESKHDFMSRLTRSYQDLSQDTKIEDLQTSSL